MGCYLNADGMLSKYTMKEMKTPTLQDCQIACSKELECNAVDYNKCHVCRMFRKACSHPLIKGWSSYRMLSPDSGPPGTYVSPTTKANLNPVDLSKPGQLFLCSTVGESYTVISTWVWIVFLII